MITSYGEAVDEIFGIFKTAWDAGSSAIAGYIPEIRWQGVEQPGKPGNDKFWVRVSQQTVTDAQSTLRNGSCGQRYTITGLVFVQLFCPKSDSESMDKGRRLSVVTRDSFRGNSTSGKVWFRNARIIELEPERDFRRFNVSAEYKYDEIN